MHDPTIATSEKFVSYAHGRTLFESQQTKLFKSVLSECRVSLVRYARERGTNTDPSEAGTPVDNKTADDWKSDIQKDEVILPKGVPFRVLGTLSYRCSLPLMVTGSANDEAMNGNAIGHNGTYWQVEVLSGKLQGARALWQRDGNAIYADTKKPCLPSVIDSQDPCPLDGA